MIKGLPTAMQSNLFDFHDIKPPYLIISLREDVHNRILSGNKLYEYRRKFINQPCNAFIYVTGKVKSIVAYAEFDTPVYESISKLIEINQSEPKPNPQGIISYFNGLSKGYAIRIKSYFEIDPLSLIELKNKYQFLPPQSYIYLEKKQNLLGDLLGRLSK